MKFNFNFRIDKRKQKDAAGNYIEVDDSTLCPIKVNLFSSKQKRSFDFSIKPITTPSGKRIVFKSTPKDFESIWSNRFKKDSFGEITGEHVVYGDKLELRIALKVKEDILNHLIDRDDILDWKGVKEEFNSTTEVKTETISDSVYDALEAHKKALEKDERFKYAKQMNTARENILKFNSNKPFSFFDVTVSWLNSYERKRRKVVSASSVNKDLGSLRTVYNIAKDKNKALEEKYPYGDPKKGKYRIPEGQGTNRGLSKEQLKKIYEFSSDNWYHQMARDYFMLSYFFHGINLKDLAQLKKGQTDYVRSKTKFSTKKESKISFKITDQMAEIISRHEGHGKYLLDIIEDNDDGAAIQKKVDNKISSIAKQMKQIARNLQLPSELSYMWAKHTVGTNLARSNVNMRTIQEVFNHTDINTTIKYINSLKDEHEDEINDALEI